MTNNYNKDLYKILNVSSDADITEIKASYRKLVRLYHPDAAGKNADENKFKEIQKAYEILSDKEERNKYDIVHGYYREKQKKKKEEAERKKYNEYIKKQQLKYKQSDDNEQEEKESFSKSINEALDNLFHNQNKNNKEKENTTSKPINGENIKTDVSISLQEAIKGTTRNVNILHTAPCPTCKGKKIINGAKCVLCNGLGQFNSQKKIPVNIPSGVKNGTEICIKDEGNAGVNGGKNGDLFLIVKIEKNKYFDVKNDDILINLPISIYEAVLGANVKIKVFDDNINVKIPPMTSSGQKLRLSGLGLENKNNKKGDVIITVVIKLPRSFSNKELDLYKKLNEMNSFYPRKDFTNEK